jgi:hypothetical protein
MTRAPHSNYSDGSGGGYSRDAVSARRVRRHLRPALAQEHIEARANGTPERVGKAPGRNDPCHCGSGMKYKKCCLNGLANLEKKSFEEMARFIAAHQGISVEQAKAALVQKNENEALKTFNETRRAALADAQRAHNAQQTATPKITVTSRESASTAESPKKLLGLDGRPLRA